MIVAMRKYVFPTDTEYKKVVQIPWVYADTDDGTPNGNPKLEDNGLVQINLKRKLDMKSCQKLELNFSCGF